MHPTTTERLYIAFRWKESAIRCNIMDTVPIWEREISDLVEYLETDVSLSDNTYNVKERTTQPFQKPLYTITTYL